MIVGGEVAQRCQREHCALKGVFMIVDVKTKIIPIWFVEKWKKENAEPGSALDVFIERMIKDWELEEIRQSK